jgi:hypothetical protein
MPLLAGLPYASQPPFRDGFCGRRANSGLLRSLRGNLSTPSNVAEMDLK